MPLRDIFVLVVIFSSIPYILKRPWFGIIMWSWLAYMNPHKISWGFARDFPVAMVIGIVTIIALLFSREPKKIPWTRETIVLVIFVSWMTLTTLSALKPEFAGVQLEKVLKIQLMTFVTLILINSPYRVNALAWTIGLSLGFYGVKGGIFTITSGGGQHVMGPAGTFIGGNNEIGLALIMTIPLLRYMQLNAKRRWMRWGMTVAIALCLIAVLGTQSRGAFLGLGAMLLFLVLKSRRRIPFLVFAAIAIPIALSVMPQTWYDRMDSIRSYEEDKSAMNRIKSWKFAFGVALERPVLGGGFEVFRGSTDAHSIYFEVLGEHGFVGLGLFLSLALLTWLTGSRVIRRSRRHPELKWAGDLARMLQVSMVGYAVAGAFLGLAYFDLYYHLVALMVVTSVLVEKHLAERSRAEEPAIVAPHPIYPR